MPELGTGVGRSVAVIIMLLLQKRGQEQGQPVLGHPTAFLLFLPELYTLYMKIEGPVT